ncbi:tyrosine-type recombinase/integrase [Tritonibacter mobilis]|uniref:tyrosine-type recombinase/integrase n=1 Tax=Tritonibacter mobilis TaxID=379347 RepID=UPI0009B9F212|nr:tyrosine-type recombinase/integrase [Tritonibacter mobilis]
MPLLIFEIAVGSVQRPSDWVDFQWGDYDGETLKLRQNKTGKSLLLPCTEALRAALDRAKAELRFVPHPSRHILTRANGSAMDYHAMARVMVQERKRLGLMAFDQHALRYRGVMELAWAGCTDDEIASFSGHTSKAMIIKYAGEARQIMRARQAAAKRK